jgi:hypothetical protein
MKDMRERNGRAVVQILNKCQYRFCKFRRSNRNSLTTVACAGYLSGRCSPSERIRPIRFRYWYSSWSLEAVAVAVAVAIT